MKYHRVAQTNRLNDLIVVLHLFAASFISHVVTMVVVAAARFCTRL